MESAMFIFDVLFTALGILLPLIAVAVVMLLSVLLGPRVVAGARQRAYDKASAAEAVRLTIAPPPGIGPDPELATELIRAVHPRQRRGFGLWKVGWPLVELSVLGRGGELSWEITAHGQMAAQVKHALRALFPGAEVSVTRPDRRVAAATAVGSLAASAAWPLGEAGSAGGRPLNRLAAALETVPDSVDVRLRLLARPLSASAWREVTPSPERPRSLSMGQIIGTALVDGVLFRSSTTSQPAQPPPPLSPEEREARERKRRGAVGFDVGLLLEVAGTRPEEAEAILWRLIDFTHPLGDGYQEIRWQIRRGPVAKPPLARLADWELAQLWYLPDASFDQAGFLRDRPLVAPPPVPSGQHADGLGLVIGESRGRSLAIPATSLSKHLAVLGATGSGKSTLLLNLALGAIEAGIGATIIDPHGDLVRDIACRIPRSRIGRVHVLRLADREHPRGFNFLERRQPGQDQLVASEFVYMLEDLWPRFCGPKMQHYLRNGLLTLLADDRPQTILELVRILTEDGFRQQFIQRLGDPMLRSFWATQWPGGAERERDASIKAVLNKLGAFVTYDSIRAVIGQGTSTIRPRDIMDRGEVLLVDLSGVGGDNATLFGAMLISRYYVDAIGRQGMEPHARRQHLLVIDEAQRFGTRAVENTSVEGRKFGLALALASQSLGGLGERMSRTIVTNAATIALLAPGADDVRTLARLFAPVTADQLLALRAFETVVRMPGRDGRPTAVGGILLPPGQGDPARAAEVIAASDDRDSRPADIVAAEVFRRSGGESEPPARDVKGPAQR
jgi:energy-coupling factor transporter ATP-binding protein EcfA2